jgi:exosome complex component RRP41
MEVLALAGLRVDGRRARELRRMRCSLGVLSSGSMPGDESDEGALPAAALRWLSSGGAGRVFPDGSAYLEQGGTKVVAVVYGPREGERRGERGERGSLSVDVWVAPYAGADRKESRVGDRRSLEMARAVAGTLQSAVLLEAYKGAEIQVSTMVLQSDGGELSACINAASMALLHAGIAMSDFVVACSAALIGKGQVVLDPSFAETSGDAPVVPVAILPRSGAVSFLRLSSRVPIATFRELTELAILGCSAVHASLREVARRDAAARFAALQARETTDDARDAHDE